MHHYFEAITNTSGDSLVGYFARVIDPGNLNTITLSADDNGTPIVVVSGVENMASTDAYGNLDFYVAPGTYHLDIYAPNATSFIMRVSNVAMSSDKGDPGTPGLPGNDGPTGPANSTYTSLASLKAAPSTNASYILTTSTGPITYAYVAGNFTNADDEVNVVKLNSVPLTTGALVRQSAGSLTYQHPLPGTKVRTAADRLNDLGLTTGDQSGLVGDGVADDAAALAALFARGNCTVLPGTYKLGSPVPIPSNRTVLVKAGVRFVWAGSTATGTIVFPINGTAGVRMVVDGPQGSTFEVYSATDLYTVYAIGGETVTNFELVGMKTTGLCRFISGGTLAYTDKVTPLMKANGDSRSINISQNVRISGGGTTFAVRPSTPSSGADFIGYIQVGRFTGAEYTRCAQGLQWWGGDASPTADGALANERKTRDLVIQSCQAYDCLGGGIWGSMGADIDVFDSVANNCLDLGFDSEGGQNIRFSRCRGSGNKNGQLNTYGFNRGIQSIDCTWISTDKNMPITNVYNVAQSQQNDDLTIRGGRMECTDTTGPSSVSTSLGALRQLTITGVMMINVKIDATANNMGSVTITNNIMGFPYTASAAFTAIRARTAQNGYGASVGVISENKITFVAQQPSATELMRLTGADPNLMPYFEVVNNRALACGVVGGFAPIVLESGGSQPTRFVVQGNRTDGPIAKSNTGAAGIYVIPDQQTITASNGATPPVITTTVIPASNINQIGSPVPITGP